MLLTMTREKRADYRAWIAAGQLCLVAGLLLSGNLPDPLRAATLSRFIASPALLATIEGFADGLSVPLVGASIFFNITGLRLYRRASAGSR